MKATAYFEESIQKHGITKEHVQQALNHEVEREVQPDGRVRCWGWVEERCLYLRVIFLPDGETLLNAFFDTNYTRKRVQP